MKIVDYPDLIVPEIKKNIDWDKVNKMLTKFRKKYKIKIIYGNK